MTTPDMAPDTFTLLDPSTASLQLLTLQGYVDRTGKTERTVRRWLAAGDLPGARKDRGGQWMIPADAVYTPGAGAALALVEPEPEPVSLAGELDALPALLALVDASRLLGVTEYAIRRNREFFGAVRLGPRGSLVVPASVVRELAGL